MEIIRRTGLHKFNNLTRLFDSLIKPIALYGAEIWGIQRFPEIEKVQARYMKGMLGLARNTPKYLWQTELGRCDLYISSLKSSYIYVTKLYQLKETRLPKICLQEYLTNKDQIKGKWWKSLEKAVNDSGAPGLLQVLKKREAIEELKDIMEYSLQITMEQQIQTNWSNIDKSSFCNFYHRINKDGTVPRYLYENNGRQRQIWINIRCGGIFRGGKKGYPIQLQNCRVCKQEIETPEHFLQCNETHHIRQEIRREEDFWTIHNFFGSLSMGTVEKHFLGYSQKFFTRDCNEEHLNNRL